MAATAVRKGLVLSGEFFSLRFIISTFNPNNVPHCSVYWFRLLENLPRETRVTCLNFFQTIVFLIIIYFLVIEYVKKVKFVNYN